VIAIVRMFRAAFPDLNISIEEQIAEGDWVASRTITRGTHQGVLFGIQPSNHTVTVPGLTMVKVVEGRIIESTVKNDMLTLLKQIGGTSLP
jgi:predicted ester cyclase